MVDNAVSSEELQFLSDFALEAFSGRFEGQTITWQQARNRLAAYAAETRGAEAGETVAMTNKVGLIELFDFMAQSGLLRIVNRSSGRVQILGSAGGVSPVVAIVAQDDQPEPPGPRYFTRPDGACGLHISALADSCGVDRKTIRDWLENAADSKWGLNRWKLDAEGVLNGGEIPEARGSVGHMRGQEPRYVVADCCWEAIVYYATRGRVEAAKSLAAIGSAGIVTLIHKATGYESPQEQRDWITKFLEQAVTINPEEMARFFPPYFIDLLSRVLRCNPGEGCFPNFYTRFYKRALPPGTFERLSEVNPLKTSKQGNKYRSNKIYQHLIVEVRDDLERGINEYTVAMRAVLSGGGYGLDSIFEKHEELYGSVLQLGLQYDYRTKRTRILTGGKNTDRGAIGTIDFEQAG